MCRCSLRANSRLTRPAACCRALRGCSITAGHNTALPKSLTVHGHLFHCLGRGSSEQLQSLKEKLTEFQSVVTNQIQLPTFKPLTYPQSRNPKGKKNSNYKCQKRGSYQPISQLSLAIRSTYIHMYCLALKCVVSETGGINYFEF